MVVITGLVAFEMGAFQPLQGANEKISHFWFGECRRDEKRGLGRVCLTIVRFAILVRAVFQHRALVVLALEFAVKGVAVGGVAARPPPGRYTDRCGISFSVSDFAPAAAAAAGRGSR